MKADLPGISKGAIAVAPKKPHQLTIAAEEQQDSASAPPDNSSHKTQRSRSYAARTLQLPDDADVQVATASLQDGVLTICWPKRAQQPGSTSIAVQ